MYIKRDIAQAVLAGAQESPVISIIGPRQSGKSTLCQELFPKHGYVDMQDPDNLQFAKADPKGFLQAKTNAHGIIIDEAQYAPELFNQIKVEVDKHHTPGRYIVSGSQNFLLNQKITESLAGRVYIYNLLPLSIHELRQADKLETAPEKQTYKGFYPGLYTGQKLIDKFYESYFFTYVERDVRSLRNIENIASFKKFIQLCFTRIGQPVNVTALAAETGITVITAKAWLSILEASFIIFFLQPYHNNIAKRVIKSPKLYFYDVGLAAHLAQVTPKILSEDRDLFGHLFENLIIVDLLKECLNRGITHQFYFFRDTNLREVDLLIKIAGKTIPIEIKAWMTIQNQYLETVKNIASDLDLKTNPVLVYAGEQTQKRSHSAVYPWNHAYALLDADRSR